MKTTKIIACLLAAWASMSSKACFAQNPPNTAMNEKAIRQYYTAYEKKDWHLLETILADGFTFSSPVDDHISLGQYKEKCWPNCNNTKRFDLEKVIVAGDDAYVTYNGWTNDGRLFRNTERFKFQDGKIIENECFFGTGVNYPNNQAKK
jgi:hypothetical protein